MYSFLPGCILYKKIALTNKILREGLPDAGLIDQEKVITFKTEEELNLDKLGLDSLTYALRLTDTIQIQVKPNNLEFARKVFEFMNVILVKRSEPINLDIVVICG